MTEIPSAWEMREKAVSAGKMDLEREMEFAKEILVGQIMSGCVCADYTLDNVIFTDEVSQALSALIGEFEAKGYEAWITDRLFGGHIHIHVSFAHATPPPEPAQ